MKRRLKLLCIFGLVAAMIAMGAAMVLPHSHAAETAHHACWICQSKAVGVSAPETFRQPDSLPLVSLAAPAAQRLLESQTSFLFSKARAPPQI